MTVNLVVFYYFLIGYFLFGVLLSLLALLVFKQVVRGGKNLRRPRLGKHGFPSEPAGMGLPSAGRA